jgi:N6-L-threonylcarbamoyladenine synthase
MGSGVVSEDHSKRPREGAATEESGGGSMSARTEPQRNDSRPLFLDSEIADICASFQRVVVASLISRTFAAARRYQAKSIGIAGGVSANSHLRAELTRHGELREIPTFLPSLPLSTDNAAMIAAAGLRKLRAGLTADLDLNADAALVL